MPKVREAIRLVEEDGWFWVRTRGSHRQYHHPVKPGTVTIAGRPGQDLDIKGELYPILAKTDVTIDSPYPYG